MAVKPILAVFLTLAVGVTVLAPTFAADKDKTPNGVPEPQKSKAAGVAKASDSAKASEKPALPDTNKMTLLIQSHMAALSQAIITENYSVLRALGAPKFQDNNSAEKLKEMFGTFKARNIDFLPVILFVPVLAQPPAIDDHGMLRLTGLYKTEPQNVLFDMLFQLVDGKWRLFGISASTQLSEAASNSVTPAK